MHTLIDIRRLHKPLMEAGLVPPNCKLWELSVGLTGALSIRYEVFLTAEQLVQLGAIFQTVGTSLIGPPAGIAQEDSHNVHTGYADGAQASDVQDGDGR